MRTIQLAGSLLLGTMLMVGCTENSPTELTDTPAFAHGRPESPGRPELPGPPEFAGPPGEVCVPFQSLVGTWTLTGFTEDGVEIDFGGTNFEFTFSSDGTFSESVTGDTGGLVCDTGTSCTDDGRYIQTDVNFLICDPHCDHIQDYTISGNTWNLSFDGGEEQEHTPFTATFVRTSGSGQPLCGPVESLVGEWTATSFTFEGEDDLVPPLSLKFAFFSNGTFTQVVVDAPPETFCDGTS